MKKPRRAQPKLKVVRVTKVDVARVLDLLGTAVAAEHPSDPSAPGVLVSSLKDGWYASVVRFREPFGAGKFVVCSARHATLPGVVAALAVRWTKRKDAKHELEVELHRYGYDPADILGE